MTITRLIRRKDLATLLGVSTRTLDRIAKQPDFPPAISDTGRRRVWGLHDVNVWFKTKAVPPSAQTMKEVLLDNKV